MPAFDTPEPISATIDITAGTVRISASDRADTVVEVRPTDPSDTADVRAAEQTQVECSRGVLLVKAPKNWARSLFGRGGSIEVTVELPSGSRVDATGDPGDMLGVGGAEFRSEGRLGDSRFSTTSGDIRLDETGRARLNTASGRISVARSAGHADITTSDGEIRIGEIDGSAVLKTSNGDITLGEVTGDARLHTASGDIAVERALATLVAKTAHGSIRVGEVVRGSVALDTRSGDLEVGIREGSAAWLDVSSQYGSVDVPPDAVDGPGEATETVEVRARTGFGDILVRRS
ncbi:DUF4097 family beta strand repeat-containing protein [Nonomuraea lactucae]|uniref:DUF4097 family beta strand repeat-containing protein n=1 Tax=Nonomuraea lactucae TaxID=2249762 RepID=UPI000DE3BCC3|nr:DUF4097 family beta strand repeat-containing protein [Nonomuraea lactucae]